MLQIERVTKGYTGDNGQRHIVLGDISLDIPANQFCCLLGASGCGKTTLLRIVAGLTQADGGTVSVADKVVHGPGQDRSMVFQNYGLLPWRNVLGNVEFGLEIRGMPATERRSICREYIRRVGLSGFERHYPHQISGGMQQRVALARAFSKEPRILLMDEPFAAVDMQTREMLQDELLRVWTMMKTTVLFVTHSIEEAVYLADRVIVMSANPGSIRADIATGLPRPRNSEVKTSPRFTEVQTLCRRALQQSAAEVA